jgi:hypothetical protein
MKFGKDLTMWFSALFVGASIYGLNIAYPIVQIHGLPETGGISDNWDKTETTDNMSYIEISDNIEMTPSPIPTKVPLRAPFLVQLLGDSMMLEGFGPRLEVKLLEYMGVTVKRFGKYSSGLNRVDFYNWYDQTTIQLKANKPDVLIVLYGANDGQNIIDLDTKIKYCLSTPQWDIVYAKRVKLYLDYFTPMVKEFYWVGHTIPRTDNFYGKFLRMNAIYKAECEKFENCHYVDSWSRFAVNGKYSATLADDKGLVKTVKGSDGVHVNTHGGNILADLVINTMKVDVEMYHR